MILDFSQKRLALVLEVDDGGAVCVRELGPAGCTTAIRKKAKNCPIAEVQICGENVDAHHGGKHVGSIGAKTLRYTSHRVSDTKNGQRVEILLTNGRMEASVFYQTYTNIAALRCWTEVRNVSDDVLGLEYVSSFALTGLGNGEITDDRSFRIFLPHNGWSSEAFWRECSLGDLGLNEATKRIALSNTGTWSTKEHLPMGALHNAGNDQTVLWQIEHNGSWQWEIGREKQMMYLRLSGPNEQEHAWYHELVPGACFESVKAALAFGEGFDGALAEMTAYRRAIFCNNQENAALPVIFNDYMNCLWADPTEEKEFPIIDKAAALGAEYYCMDAGWYANGTWWETVGEWQPYGGRFPNGIKRVFDYIREKGMIPGIWLEIEVMGINCPLATEWEDECFFLRHGKRVIDHGRYQLDFRHPKVRAHATATVDRVVREYGVGYIKMDYNIEAGVGTEVDADSFGDGLLAHNRAYLAWLDEILAKYPDLIWENCSSGGMRMEYAMLQRAHLQSVTDQSNYRKIAPIAAAAPTAVLPEQAAIWSYPKATDDLSAVTFNMVSSMLQRIHLSGQVQKMSDAALDKMREGVALYKELRSELATAVPFYPVGLPDDRSGWLCLGMKTEKRTLLAVWRMDGEATRFSIPCVGCASVLYASECSLVSDSDGLCVTLPQTFSAAILSVEA